MPNIPDNISFREKYKAAASHLNFTVEGSMKHHTFCSLTLNYLIESQQIHRIVCLCDIKIQKSEEKYYRIGPKQN